MSESPLGIFLLENHLNFKLRELTNSFLVVDGFDFAQWSYQHLANKDKPNLLEYKNLLTNLFQNLKKFSLKPFFIFGTRCVKQSLGTLSFSVEQTDFSTNSYDRFAITRVDLILECLIDCIQSNAFKYVFLANPPVVELCCRLATTLKCPILASKTAYFVCNCCSTDNDRSYPSFIPLDNSINGIGQFIDGSFFKVHEFNAPDSALRHIPPSRLPMVDILLILLHRHQSTSPQDRLPSYLLPMNGSSDRYQQFEAIVEGLKSTTNLSLRTLISDIATSGYATERYSAVCQCLNNVVLSYTIPIGFDVMQDIELRLYDEWGIIDHTSMPLLADRSSSTLRQITAFQSVDVVPVASLTSKSVNNQLLPLQLLHGRLLASLSPNQLKELNSCLDAGEIASRFQSLDFDLTWCCDRLLTECLQLSELPAITTASDNILVFLALTFCSVIAQCHSSTDVGEKNPIVNTISHRPGILTALLSVCCMPLLAAESHLTEQEVHAHLDKLISLKPSSPSMDNDDQERDINYTSVTLESRQYIDDYLNVQHHFILLRSLIKLINCIGSSSDDSSQFCSNLIFDSTSCYFPPLALPFAAHVADFIASYPADQRVKVVKNFWLKRLCAILPTLSNNTPQSADARLIKLLDLINSIDLTHIYSSPTCQGQVGEGILSTTPTPMSIDSGEIPKLSRVGSDECEKINGDSYHSSTSHYRPIHVPFIPPPSEIRKERFRRSLRPRFSDRDQYQQQYANSERNYDNFCNQEYTNQNNPDNNEWFTDDGRADHIHSSDYSYNRETSDLHEQYHTSENQENYDQQMPRNNRLDKDNSCNQEYSNQNNPDNNEWFTDGGRADHIHSSDYSYNRETSDLHEQYHTSENQENYDQQMPRNNRLDKDNEDLDYSSRDYKRGRPFDHHNQSNTDNFCSTDRNQYQQQYTNSERSYDNSCNQEDRNQNNHNNQWFSHDGRADHEHRSDYSYNQESSWSEYRQADERQRDQTSREIYSTPSTSSQSHSFSRSSGEHQEDSAGVNVGHSQGQPNSVSTISNDVLAKNPVIQKILVNARRDSNGRLILDKRMYSKYTRDLLDRYLRDL